MRAESLTNLPEGWVKKETLQGHLGIWAWPVAGVRPQRRTSTELCGWLFCDWWQAWSHCWLAGLTAGKKSLDTDQGRERSQAETHLCISFLLHLTKFEHCILLFHM